MAVHDGVHIRALLIDFTVDEMLTINRAAIRIDGLAIEIEGDDVVDCNIARGDRLHLQIAFGIARIANADMTE